MKTSTVGFVAEGIAAKFLQDQQYVILDHNWRRPWGEIDIIAKKGSKIIFVEVKASRTQSSTFAPEIRADWQKMQKVIRTARTYLLANKYSPEQEWQIDVISVNFDQKQDKALIKHFRNMEF